MLQAQGDDGNRGKLLDAEIPNLEGSGAAVAFEGEDNSGAEEETGSEKVQ